MAGYQAHLKRGEQTCQACRVANTEYARNYHAGKVKGLKPSEVYQDQRRGSQGQDVVDQGRAKEGQGKTATAPKRKAPAPAPAVESSEPVNRPPRREPVAQEHLAPAPDVPEAPAYLRAQGRELWDRVLADYDLNPAGMALLGEACRTVDRLERMAAALSSRSTLWFEVEESLEEQGQDGAPVLNVVVNGMVGEARHLQNVLRSTLKELGVTEVTPRASSHDQPRESLTDELKRKRQERLAAAREQELEG